MKVLAVLARLPAAKRLSFPGVRLASRDSACFPGVRLASRDSACHAANGPAKTTNLAHSDQVNSTDADSPYKCLFKRYRPHACYMQL